MIARSKSLCFVVSLLLAWAGPALAQSDIKLPQTVTWSSYNVGSTIYGESVAISSAVKKKVGIDMRILPAKNDISRMAPLKSGQVQFSATGNGSFFAQEGMFEFATKQWGPQDISLIAVNFQAAHVAAFVSSKVGVKSFADMRGKRVPRIRGAPSLNEIVRGVLAFGGLTLNDVTQVEVPGYGAMLQAFMQGRVDLAVASSRSPVSTRADASPHGPILWPSMPHEDKAAWARIKGVLPFVRPIKAGKGVRIDPPFDGMTYPLPVVITYNSQDPNLVYNMTKAIDKLYPEYKDATKSIGGFKMRSEALEFPVPFHPGAVRYFKEIGIWTADHEAENAKKIKRQQVLAAAWKAQRGKSLDGDAFVKDWMANRAAALEKAGLAPIWK